MRHTGLARKKSAKTRPVRSIAGARQPLRRSTPLRASNPERQAKRQAKYAAHLRGPHLRELRPLVWARDKGTCQQCHRPVSPKGWHLAHRTYSRFGHELPEDLEVNCPDCNQAERVKRRWYSPID